MSFWPNIVGDGVGVTAKVAVSVDFRIEFFLDRQNRVCHGLEVRWWPCRDFCGFLRAGGDFRGSEQRAQPAPRRGSWETERRTLPRARMAATGRFAQTKSKSEATACWEQPPSHERPSAPHARLHPLPVAVRVLLRACSRAEPACALRSSHEDMGGRVSFGVLCHVCSLLVACCPLRALLPSLI